MFITSRRLYSLTCAPILALLFLGSISFAAQESYSVKSAGKYYAMPVSEMGGIMTGPPTSMNGDPIKVKVVPSRL